MSWEGFVYSPGLHFFRHAETIDKKKMDLSGQIIAERYVIADFISEGGTSVVFRARGIDGSMVVLKILKEGGVSRRIEDIIRFHAEALTVSNIRHRGIVRIHEIGELPAPLAPGQSVHYLVMEHIQGTSMQGELDRGGSFTFREALLAASQVSDALAHVHDMGIVHRDIKPGNIMISGRGEDLRAVIIDFGFAHVREFFEGSIRGVTGTFGFMSPEQSGIIRRPVDERSDLYSLGVVLYRLVTGRLPYEGSDALAIIHQHIAKKPLPPSAHNPQIPPAIERVILKLLEKEPVDRYQSAHGLLYDIKMILSGSRDIMPGAADRQARLNSRTGVVGRDGELARLKARYGELAEGRGSICLVAGEAGLGKTRLAEELRDHVISSGGVFIEGNCFSGENKVPYGPFKEALNQFLRHFPKMRERYRLNLKDRVRSIGVDRCGVVLRLNPMLVEITGLCPDPVDLEPERENRRFLMVAGDFFRALGDTQAPLVLFLDNLQWSDEGSFALMEEMISGIAFAPLMILGAYRVNEVSASHGLLGLIQLAERAGYPLERLSLDPLDHPSLTRFVHGLLGSDDPYLDRVVDVVYRKSRGNPFFALEIVKRMVGEGALVLTEMRWSADEERLGSLEISSRILDAVMLRIAGLSSRSNEVLSYAAVIGRKFDISLLFDLLVYGGEGEKYSHNEIVGIVDEAVAKQLLETHRRERGKLFFVHDRIREAFYDMLSADRRRILHLRIAQTLEETPEGPEYPVFDLVFHYSQAGNVEKTLKYAYPAGMRAMESYANEDAIRYFTLAVEMLQRDGAGAPVDIPLWLECQARIGGLFLVTGRNDEAIGIFTRVLPRLESSMARATAYRQISHAYFKKGDFANCERYGAEGLALLGERLPLSTWRVVSGILREFAAHLLLKALPGLLRFRGGRTPAESDLLIIQFYHSMSWNYALSSLLKFVRSTLRMLNISERRIGVSRELAISTLGLGMMYAAIPAFRWALPYLELGLDISTKIRDTFYMAVSRQLLGTFYSWTGDLGKSTDLLLESYENFRRIGDIWEIGQVNNIASVNRYYTSNYEQSIRHLNEWIEISGKIHNDYGLCNGLANLAWVYTDLGDHAKALECAGKSLDLSARQGIWFAHFLACAYAGYCRSEMNDHQGAIEFLDRGRELDRKRRFTLRVYTAPLYVYRAEAYTRLYLDLNSGPKGPSAFKLRAMMMKACREALARSRGWPLIHCAAVRVAAQCAEALGRDKKAVRLYREAIGLCARAGRRFELGRAYLGLGGLLSRVCKDDEASSCFDSARRLFAEVGSRHYRKMADECLGPGAEERNAIQRLTDHQRLSSIIGISQDMSSILNLDELLEHIMDRAMEVTGARRGYLLLTEGETGGLIMRVARNIDGEAIPEYSRGVIDEVSRTRRTVITTNAEKEEKFTGFQSVLDYGLKSILCIPITGHDRLVGVCYLDNQLSGAVFTDDDADLLRVFMTQAAISIENANLYASLEDKVARRTETIEKQKRELENQIALAEKIQRALLPVGLPKLDMAEMAFRYEPNMRVGGDFFDVLYDSERGLLGLVMGDVSGHGMPAALLASMTKVSLQSWRHTLHSPAWTLSMICDALLGKLSSHFLSVCVCCLDLATGRLICSSAGHPEPLLTRGAFGIEIVNVRGRVIADAFGPCIYAERTMTLRSGDGIVLYTDGVIEARNGSGEIFGEERLQGALLRLGGNDPRSICDNIFAMVRGHADSPGGIDDDFTMLVVKYTGQSGRTRDA
ncbi:MAG: Serine/threonine-protein kinase PrkC [Spirochaetes bacterium ADurb.BinA120]|nr:MAG: Serine/threonine-protein kinase PrkC [Spirochaetes bacterium ADurb.BinA120]